MCVRKRELIFENYKECLSKGKVILKSQQRFKSDHHKVYREEVNEIALSSGDDKRLQTFDRITRCPSGTPWCLVCKSEMLMVCEAKKTSLSKDCENNMYVTRNIFLKHMEAKCKNES